MSGKVGRWRHLQVVLFLCSVLPLQLISGSTTDPSSSKEGKTASHSSSNNSTGIDVLYVCLGVVAVVLLAGFLFKLWQKKKREAQHARLLRLFEEDDELELELGLRD